MSFHHWMYFGCQCSSARCSRLLLERSTLFGIFSAEIMRPRSQGHKGHTRPPFVSFVSARAFSCARPIELRPPLLPVDLQRALLADGVRPLEDPVLPRGQPS